MSPEYVATSRDPSVDRTLEFGKGRFIFHQGDLLAHTGPCQRRVNRGGVDAAGPLMNYIGPTAEDHPDLDARPGQGSPTAALHAGQDLDGDADRPPLPGGHGFASWNADDRSAGCRFVGDGESDRISALENNCAFFDVKASPLSSLALL